MNEPLEKSLESIYQSISETDFSNSVSLDCADFGDLIFDLIGDLLDEDNFLEVDNLLKIVDFNRLESYSIVSFLSIMHPYDRSRLSNWQSFYENCKIQLLKTKTIEKTEKLLKGFEEDPPVGTMNILNYF